MHKYQKFYCWGIFCLFLHTERVRYSHRPVSPEIVVDALEIMKQSRYLLLLASWNWKVLGIERGIFICIFCIYLWTFAQSTHYVLNLHLTFGTIRGITLAEKRSFVSKTTIYILSNSPSM